MASSYRIDKAQRIVYSTYSGVVTYSVISAIYDALKTDPDFDPTFNAMAYYDETVDAQLSLQDLRRLGEVELYAPTSKRAVVMHGRHLAYTLAVTYEALLKGKSEERVRVFDHRSDALNWLGLADDSSE